MARYTGSVCRMCRREGTKLFLKGEKCFSEKCALGKRGRPSHEWNDGKKDHIYCLGWVDPMTDAPLPECLACPDFVDKAQDDLEAFYGGADNG